MSKYTFTTLLDTSQLVVDIEVLINDKKIRMLGTAGIEREFAVLQPWTERTKPQALPVLLGLGMGHALNELLQSTEENKTPVCLIDKETNIADAVKINQRYPHLLEHPRLTFITTENPQECLTAITQWQNIHKGLPLFPIINPFYLRIDRDFYHYIQEQLTASLNFDFWAKARKKRFAGKSERLLLITSKYFLMGEIVSACQRLGIEHRLVLLEEKEMLKQEFVQQLLKEIVEFQPDAVLTLNHLGVDRDGVVQDILARLELPLASWFVDNPHLVLHTYQRLANKWLTIFTWDNDNIDSLHAQGFEHVYYLPLGTDPVRFNPDNSKKTVPHSWNVPVSFVGNSMRTKVAGRLNASKPPRELLLHYKEIAKHFSEVPTRAVYEFMSEHYQNIMPYYNNLLDEESKLAFETMLTWEATRHYRFTCVKEILPFTPLIVGDKAWVHALKKQNTAFQYMPALSYYDELPFFYTHSQINFNTTSMQMKGAVNQRIFDVPATASFVLTDWREQMDALLDFGTEIIAYKEIGEISELVSFYLKHESVRKKIISAGRKRVLNHHTWDKRILQIIKTLKDIYAK